MSIQFWVLLGTHGALVLTILILAIINSFKSKKILKLKTVQIDLEARLAASASAIQRFLDQEENHAMSDKEAVDKLRDRLNAWRAL